MLSIIAVFVASCVISFIGSLQLGPVNLYVINSVLNFNKKTALAVAIGGSIPEFIYCSLAVFASDYIQKSETLNYVFKIVFIIILLIIAVIYFRKKITSNNISKISAPQKSTYYQSALKGFALAMLNPQLLPFWIFVKIYFDSFNLLTLKTELHYFSFILGAGLGAFFLLATIITFVSKYKALILTYMNNKYYYKVLSILFLLIAIQQLFSL